jgi:lantibiotic modifying enzyme|tara:strand:+ start:159 stop:437 length:279 start_codon:yes stop_codon:yes gene_type:complete
MSKVKTIEVDHKEVKSISEDQLKGLQETVNQQNKIQMQIGGIEGHKAGLIIQLQEIVAELSKQQAELEKEYGSVNIDLQTGEISEVDVPASN